MDDSRRGIRARSRGVRVAAVPGGLRALEARRHHTGSAAGHAARLRRVRFCVGRADRLCVSPLAPARPRRARARGSQRAPGQSPVRTMTSGHFIFIPSVLLVGIVIGWILGSGAAKDAYAMELKKREEREKVKGQRSEVKGQ